VKLHALYTSEWAEGDVVTWASVCTSGLCIDEVQQSLDGEFYEHHEGDHVQIELNGAKYFFEADSGIFTEKGTMDFTHFVNDILFANDNTDNGELK
jgi:hypothetical protein